MMPAVVSHVRANRMPVEEVPAGERAAIEHMIESLKQQLTRRYIDNHQLVRRDAHPKILGLVEARLVVSPDCPVELRHGIFAKPGRTLDAYIRYSNGNPVRTHDLAFDVRGMAIKLPGEDGDFLGEPGQDFLLATAEAFFGSNAVDYVDFPDASVSFPKTVWYFIRGMRLRGGLQLVSGMKIPASPLSAEYFSQTPYRLGPHCVKYHVRSLAVRSSRRDPWYMRPIIRHVLAIVAKVVKRLPKSIPADALRRALMRDLAGGAVMLEFFVQRWPDLSQMPTWAIENATRVWPAPWAKVATIEVPQQCGIAERDDEAERMTFSPWHAKREHQPLGSINRARLAIYRTMSTFRNAHNPGGNGGAAQAIVCPSCNDSREAGASQPT